MIVVPRRQLWLSEWLTTGKTGRKSTGKLPRLSSGRTCRHGSGSGCCGQGPLGNECGNCVLNSTPATIKVVTSGITELLNRDISLNQTWCLTQDLTWECTWKVRHYYACMTLDINGVETPIVALEVEAIMAGDVWYLGLFGIPPGNGSTKYTIRSVQFPIQANDNCSTAVTGNFTQGGSFTFTPRATCASTLPTCATGKGISDPCDCKPLANPKIRLTFDVPILAGCQTWNDGTYDWAWKVSDSTTYFTDSYELDSGGMGYYDDTWNLLHDYNNSECSGDWGSNSNYLAVGVVWDCEKIEVSVIVHSNPIGMSTLFYGYASSTETMIRSCSGFVLTNNPDAWVNHPYAGFTRGLDMQDTSINSGGECAVSWVET